MEEDSAQHRLPSLPDARQKAVDELVRQYAADHISVDEFERRVDIAHRTHDLADLQRLTADLPAVRAEPRVVPEADRLIGRGARAVADAVRESQTLLAVMGGVERRGRWTPARRNVVVVAMGGAELDFREARFATGVTEVFIFALMGGATLIVPPGLAVDASAIPIMGGFEHRGEHHEPGDAADPVLKVRGLVVMGGIDIQVRHAGESAQDAKRRRKEQKRRRRENE